VEDLFGLLSLRLAEETLSFSSFLVFSLSMDQRQRRLRQEGDKK
jgi:hypothetical protein